MARFECELCGQEFEQRSRLERHMETSHPPRAPSAADLERALAGMDFPAGRDDLVEHARRRAGDETGAGGADASSRAPSAEEVVDVLSDLPDHRYRDAAEVARALGGIRRREEKPDHQPSELGGKRALEALSAARFAGLMEGISFPVTDEELRQHAADEATDEEMEILERFDGGPYEDMAEVAEELGRHRG